MKSFVKVNNGTFPNLNFYMAWEGLTQMGYDVTLFEEKDIDNLDITTATPVFAGVTVFRKIMDKLGVNYPPFDCYPKVLESVYGRTIRRSTVGIERKKFNDTGVPVFVKPVKPKVFIGNVWESFINLIPLANIKDNELCYVCDPITILSEFRVYVYEGEILGVKHYWGDWHEVPQKEFVSEVVKMYKPCPIAYGVDIAVTRPKDKYYDLVDIVMEVNDGCNLGNYGLDSIHYGEMLVSRWFEIVGTKMNLNSFTAEIHQRIKENNMQLQFDITKTVKQQTLDEQDTFIKEEWSRV